MRLDRLTTLGVVGPIRRLVAPLGDRQSVLPVLMYHSISNDDEQGRHPYYRVCTSPQRFAEQMQWLAAAGYRGVALSEGLAALHAQSAKGEEPRSKRIEQGVLNQAGGGPRTLIPQLSTISSPKLIAPSSADHRPPSTVYRGDQQLVALTFDDGFRDFYSTAVSIMRRHGFSATMYLPTAFISEERKSYKSRDCMTWQEVRELQQQGMEFGSHTVNHPRLVEVAWPQIEAELRNSRADLEQHLGVPIRHFAYPHDYPQENHAFTRRFRTLLPEAGYLTSVTTVIGRMVATSDLHQLPRLPANSDDDQALFSAKLAGDYDWLARPQMLSKKLRGWFQSSAI